MRVAVTGASGFLGRRVAAALAARGNEVAVLARRASALTIAGVTVLRYDGVEDAKRTIAHLAPDVLIHLAAAQGRRDESASTMLEANLALGVALLESLPNHGLFINADTTLPADLNLYAYTKAKFADLARFLVARGHIQARILNARFQTIYGPGDDPAKFVASLALQLVADAAPLITTPGTQRRDFIHVDDATSAILAAIDQRNTCPAWQDLPIGSGTALPLATFIEKAIVASGFRHPWQRSLPLRPGEMPEMVADTTLLSSWGWTPQITIEEGIAQVLADARSRATPGRVET